jgi:hypothetical protein
MSNPANEPVQPAPGPSPASAAAAAAPVSSPAPSAVVPAPGVKKPGSSGVLVIVFGVLGAAAAIGLGLMSRSIAAPQASTAAPPPARAAAAPRAVGGALTPSRWTNGSRWVSDRKSTAFELKSSNRVNVWMGQVQPVLVVRCIGNRTETFVYTETAARIEPGMDDRAVRVRFDDEPYVDERWLDSEEHKGLFAPNGKSYAQRVLNAHTLRFQFTPHNAETAEVQFDVAGLRELIAPVQKRCGWEDK